MSMKCGCREGMRGHMRDTRREIKLEEVCMLQKLILVRDGIRKITESFHEKNIINL